MSITLTNGATALALDPDLFWSDENSWTPVVQTVSPSITGALIVMAAARTAGRAITLEPEDDSSSWMPRSSVDLLRNWAAVPGLPLVLTLRDETRTVIFRHQDGGFEARPVLHRSDVVAGDQYLCTIRLMEI